MKTGNGRYIGIDLGKRSMEVHIIKTNGKHESWTCKTDIEGRVRLLSRLLPGDTIGMEACPLAFILYLMIHKNLTAKVHVLNPHGLAMIFRSTKKTDREDAAKLAWVVQRLPEHELPIVAIPSQEEQELRSLVSEQVALTQARTREINHLHALFVQDGITTIGKSDLSCHENRELLYPQLSPLMESRAHRYERLVLTYEDTLAEVEAAIQGLIAKNPLTPILMSLPGVGPNLVAAFLGFIGDGQRFQRNTIAAYAGLVPRVDCSGDKNHYGPITKQGCSILRRAMVQGAWGLARSTETGVLQRKYSIWKKKMGAKKSIVALARKMLETLWVLAVRREMYIDYNPEKLKQKLTKYQIIKENVA